jgi:hypothetical protein
MREGIQGSFLWIFSFLMGTDPYLGTPDANNFSISVLIYKTQGQVLVLPLLTWTSYLIIFSWVERGPYPF